jgi:hypothetical protein
MFSFFDMLQFKSQMLNKNKNVIQDGDETFFIFHISRHFDFLAWQQCFYFYLAFELQHIKK